MMCQIVCETWKTCRGVKVVDIFFHLLLFVLASCQWAYLLHYYMAGLNRLDRLLTGLLS